MATVKNFGILEGIDWNSHNWQYHSSEEDIKKSKFGYVTENSKTHTSLNFGHDIYPADEKGYYPGLLPHLWSRGLDRDNSKFVCCIFMKSRNYKDGNIYIIGMYAFPEFIKSSRKSPIAGDDFIFQSNVQAKPENIVYLRQSICLTAHKDSKRILPPQKQQGNQGFNYLHRENVEKILDLMTFTNPEDKKLSKVKLRLLREMAKH